MDWDEDVPIGPPTIGVVTLSEYEEVEYEPLLVDKHGQPLQSRQQMPPKKLGFLWHLFMGDEEDDHTAE